MLASALYSEQKPPFPIRELEVFLFLLNGSEAFEGSVVQAEHGFVAGLVNLDSDIQTPRYFQRTGGVAELTAFRNKHDHNLVPVGLIPIIERTFCTWFGNKQEPVFLKRKNLTHESLNGNLLSAEIPEVL